MRGTALVNGNMQDHFNMDFRLSTFKLAQNINYPASAKKTYPRL